MASRAEAGPGGSVRVEQLDLPGVLLSPLGGGGIAGVVASGFFLHRSCQGYDFDRAHHDAAVLLRLQVKKLPCVLLAQRDLAAGADFFEHDVIPVKRHAIMQHENLLVKIWALRP